jgi:hypothetical protein
MVPIWAELCIPPRLMKSHKSLLMACATKLQKGVLHLVKNNGGTAALPAAKKQRLANDSVTMDD